MFKKTTTADEVSQNVLQGFSQLLKEEDVQKLFEKAFTVSDHTALMLGVNYVCFWLYLVYADLKMNEPQNADLFMHEIISKTTHSLNDFGKAGFLNLASIKPDVLEKYFNGSWASLEPKTRSWMDSNHKLMQLKPFENESWLGQLTMLLCAHVSLLVFNNKEEIDDLYEWMVVFQSCSATAIGYGNVYVDTFKKYKAKI